ncbi:MAG: PQQ-binding-like beta-propeller repeat protein, partial [Planctomycetes bacterium]|nr:PQQ-binding-like beta-propeller repeat protein [Planctomycetota bacterium]
MQRSEKSPYFAALITFSILWASAVREAMGDWPTYRADGHRSGITSERLELPLGESWVHRATEPRPAWPEMPARKDVYRDVKYGPTVVFDRAPHVVSDGESVYYGSSADDTVYCLDMAGGATRWSFTTEGPVRLTPTVADGRVYAASDDGCVYCLDAGGGKLLWKHRVGPEDRRLPGNGRMISLWPVRCGVVVDGGTVYVSAGLFPSQGAYLCALSAEDGKALWKEPVDISAQGYLLASPERLFIPTGRTPPHIYRRTDGQQVAAFPGLGQQRSGTPEGGGCFAVLVENQLLHQAGEKGGIQVTDAGSREKVVTTSGLRVIARGPMAYILHEDRLTALDRATHFELAGLESKKKKSPADEERIGELKKSHEKWSVPCAAPYELIMAGQTIFAGGADQVVAYAAADGKQLWTGEVAGKAHSLSVAGGRLFVGTDRGAIHSFRHGSSKPSGDAVSQQPEQQPTSPYPEDEATALYGRAAATALRAAGPQRG